MSRIPIVSRPLLLLCLCVALTPAVMVRAHEVPGRVVVNAFVKPDGDSLRVLLRVPLESLRDVSIPTRGPGYLDLEAAPPVIRDAARVWLGNEMTFYQDGRRLPPGHLVSARVSLPSSRAFGDYASALAHLGEPPLPPDTELYWEQGLLDVLFEYPIDSAAADLAMELRLAHLGVRTLTVLRFLPPDGPERLFQYQGNPGRVSLDPAWHQAAGQFVMLGFHHVLDGIDHLLFVFCLVLPFRRLKPLVMLVTAFTLAHSLTLAAAALGMAPRGGWFAPLIEALIAVSILYLALENLWLGWRGGGLLGMSGAALERRWLTAFGFGLVHGFGFAFVLSDSLQFAGSHLVVSLAAFNVGIELGQLLVVVLALAVLGLLLRLGLPRGFTLVVASVAVAHTAWHWLLERGAVFLAYPLTWPAMDAAWWAAALRWALLALVAITIAWLMNLACRRWVGVEGAGEL